MASLVSQIIALLERCSPQEFGAVQEYMTTHPHPIDQQHALDHDVANVAKHFGGGEGEESSMMIEVQIMSITGDVFSVDISSDSTVPNDCRRLLADDIIVLLLTR